MTDIEKIQRVEYKSHLLQVKTCGAVMDLMIALVNDTDMDTVEQAKAIRDLSVAVANVGGRVPQP